MMAQCDAAQHGAEFLLPPHVPKRCFIPLVPQQPSSLLYLLKHDKQRFALSSDSKKVLGSVRVSVWGLHHVLPVEMWFPPGTPVSSYRPKTCGLSKLLIGVCVCGGVHDW